MPGALPRVHLVTPAIVERTVARHGVRGILTNRERETLDAFAVERRRVDWLAGRVAAKRAVRRTLRDRGDDVPPLSAIDVWNDATGAPRFAVAARPELSGELSLSISHSNGTGLAAVADTRASGTVGVDIEQSARVSMALVSRVLSERERQRLAAGDSSPSPLALWTAKEAALKAASHLCGALRDIELSWVGVRCVGARVTRPGRAAHDIVVRHRTVGAYTVAIALCR